MSKIFMFYLGGSAPGANIEVHDVQFAVGECPEDTFPALRERWFGDKASLHLDAYSEINWADGHDVFLSAEPTAHKEKLYFVNMGAYLANEFHELHRFALFVAENEKLAREKARSALLNDAMEQHKDNQMAVDECLQLSELEGLHVHLRPNPGTRPFRADWHGYRPIAGS